MPVDPTPSDLPFPPSADTAVVADQIAAEATSPASGHAAPVHTHCQNCGTALTGPFCHRCGQHDFDFDQSFGHLVLEALENFFHFDAKFFRTIFTLLFRPGRLTAAYNAGQRASQVPPLRLYIFVSFLFFLISFFHTREQAVSLNLPAGLTPEKVAAGKQVAAAALAATAADTPEPEAQAWLKAAASKLQPADPATPVANPPAPDAAITAPGTGVQAHLQTRPDGTPGIYLSTKPGDDNAFNRFMTEKGNYALAHPREVTTAFVHALPKMLLFCLPLYALYTRLLFRRRYPNYLPHLVAALHFHTFIFLWRLVANGVIFALKPVSSLLANWSATGSNLWLVLYPLFMFRFLCGDSWKRTLAKSVVLAVVYGFTLALGFLVTAVIVFAEL